MVRAPCCEKMGLKKGPWSRDEDQILINHVTLYGHGNWRALPKQAGLLRCGKSCRLRWTNYLKPDIKRGNFSAEEEETIINLHEVLGNRWSAIAARLPGRTDNEIKNVWHTHLKKKLKKNQETSPDQISKSKLNVKSTQITKFEHDEGDTVGQPKQMNSTTQSTSKADDRPNSPQQISTFTTTSSSEDNNTSVNTETFDDFLEVDESFWSDVFSTDENSGNRSDCLGENSGATSDFNGGAQLQFPFTPFNATEFGCGNNLDMNDGMDFFWYDIFTKSAGELPEF